MSVPAYNLPSVALAGDRLQVYNCYRFKEALSAYPAPDGTRRQRPGSSRLRLTASNG